VSDAFAHLAPEDQARAAELAERFRSAGAEEAEAWALSEVEENIPQLARFLFLRRLWRSAAEWDLAPAEWFAERQTEPADDGEAEDADEAAETGVEAVDEDAEPAFLSAQQAVGRILAAGADPEDLREVARAIFLYTAFDAVHTVDDGHDPDAGEGMPGWFLAEVGGDLIITGRAVDNLHEDLLTTEPD
jgi:hypothetical protein